MDTCLNFIIDYLYQRGIELTAAEIASAHLVEDGILDSFGILSLFMAVEEEFGITIFPKDMLEKKHATVKGLASLIVDRGTNETSE